MGKNKDKKQYTPLEKWFRFLHKVEKVLKFFLPYRAHFAVQGKDLKDGGYILVGNHYRIWDVMYSIMMFPNKPVHFMAKQELWEGSKFMHWFVVKSECIPVSRDGTGTDVKAIMQAMRYVKNGEVINIFPEGRRNKENVDMLPFKGGSAAISIKTKTPIIPIVQIKKAKLFRKSDILYGKPIEFTEYYGKKLTDENIAECEERLRSVMLGMRQEFIEQKAAAKNKKK
ncbi:MAG: 1-acyl-sn-glycerol-3-phosphate acyltransferase [Clostridia bacterium]|nr:1-acyl-sn-glycerol-3-phosphate acyltransferase [Clostridia bacterium]